MIGVLGTRRMLTIDYLEQNKITIDNVSLKERKNIKILFVDDEGYDIEPLKKIGFLDVSKQYEYTKIDDYEKYDIIFCDINGIGKEIDDKYQGAALAKIIKNTYPNKVVIIFSAKQQYLDMHEFSKFADEIIAKNIQISDLTDLIDKYIKKLSDPVEYWKETRRKLLSQGVSTKTVCELEHYYVKSFKNKKGYIDDIRKVSKDINISDGITIINGVIEVIKLYINSKMGNIYEQYSNL